MHIMFLANASSIHTIRWVNILSKFGNRVTLVTCHDHLPTDNSNSEIDPSIEIIGLPFSTARNLGYFLNAIACRRIAKKINPDVINAHYASGYGTLARVARLKPLALSVWGSDVYVFPEKSAIHKSLVKANLKYANAVMSTSFTMGNQVKKLLKSPNFPIAITPFGVDIEKFSVKKIESTNNYPLSVGIIKTLRHDYGIQDLIKAVSMIQEHINSSQGDQLYHLHIYGDGPGRKEFENLTISLQVKDYVTFHGSIPNNQVPATLNSLDIFVMPSLHESFGVAAVEAMAAGLPVITSDATGLVEIVTNEINGLRFPATNSKILAEKLFSLIENPSLRQSLGSAARTEVENRFSFDKNARVLEDVLRSISVS